MIGAGALDRRISVTRQAQAGTDPAYGTPIFGTVTVAADVPASVRQTGGREFLDASQIVAERRVVFTIRWLDGVLVTDSITWEGRIHDVRDIREVGRRRFLEIHAEAVE